MAQSCNKKKIRPKSTSSRRQSSKKRNGHCKMEKIVDQIMPTIGRGSRTEYDIPMERDKSLDIIVPQKPKPISESQRKNCANIKSMSIR